MLCSHINAAIRESGVHSAYVDQGKVTMSIVNVMNVVNMVSVVSIQ